MICWENSLIDDFVLIFINDSSKVKYIRLFDFLIFWFFMGFFFYVRKLFYFCVFILNI